MDTVDRSYITCEWFKPNGSIDEFKLYVQLLAAHGGLIDFMETVVGNKVKFFFQGTENNGLYFMTSLETGPSAIMAHCVLHTTVVAPFIVYSVSLRLNDKGEWLSAVYSSDIHEDGYEV